MRQIDAGAAGGVKSLDLWWDAGFPLAGMDGEWKSTSEHRLGLHWLIRLRWIAVAGFTVICVVSAWTFGVVLPVPVLAACIGFVALSNGWLAWQRKRSGGGGDSLVAAALAFDILVLTAMLYFTAGANNPFTLFYLLHITMAVILLPSWGAWGAVGLCTAGFWLLFQSEYTLVSTKGNTCCDDVETHLRGLVVAMALTGCGIAYFSRRLMQDLRESRRLVALAQADGERVRRAMEVATLAAGIAHELATPLSTIALVSGDLERVAGESGAGGECVADARVIRKEVERCRMIVEKLGMAGRMEPEARGVLEWDSIADLLNGYLAEPLRERVEFHFDPSNKRLMVQKSRLLQCISILVKNGVEAAPQGTIVRLDGMIEGDECVFRVSDLGPGFPVGMVERIGEPMVSSKAKSGGLGLGLYLVKAFVTELAGSVDVHKVPDEETVVTMRIPCEAMKIA